MLPLTPSTPPVRDPNDLRQRIDAKLGSGMGMQLEQARERLSPAERAEWALSECLTCMLDRRFHIWVQSWCEGQVDGPAVIAVIAEATRPLDGLVADLLRWTSLRGTWARSGERKEALFNVVPEVWHGALDRLKPFLHAVQTCWPEDADPFSLPQPTPWSRSTSFTRPRLAFTHAARVMEETAFALWSSGASEDELDSFFVQGCCDLYGAVLTRVDCDGQALRALLPPPTSLALALGLEKIAFPSLLFAAPERESEILKLAEAYDNIVLRPTPAEPFSILARTALRYDVDMLTAWTRDLGQEEIKMLRSAYLTGHAILLFGSPDDLPQGSIPFDSSPEIQ